MKNLILFLCLSFSMTLIASPNEMFHYSTLVQKKKKSGSFDKSRLLIGPGLGFGAAYRTFSINISPSVAYCLTNNFHVGSTLGFNYFQASESYINPITNLEENFKHKYPAYSLSVFARYMLFDYLILNFEPELNNTKFVNSYSYDLNTGKIIEQSRRLFVPSVLVGGGYAQRMGDFAYSYIMVCYDLVQNPNARYYQTIDYRVGIMFSPWR